MVFETKRNGYLENKKSNGESRVWCQISGQKKYRRYDGYVGNEVR